VTKYSNHIECSEEIVAHLARNVPAPWRLIEVLAEIVHEDEMVTTECIYYPTARRAKKDWFGIDDAHENVRFARCFIELAHLTSTPELGLFKRCKFTLESDGKYRTEYEY
jgi:hypothetical protein